MPGRRTTWTHSRGYMENKLCDYWRDELYGDIAWWASGRLSSSWYSSWPYHILINKENFITRLGGQELQSFPDKIRRLSIQSDCTEEEMKQITVKNGLHIRSLNTFDTSLVSEFHCLRVLDLGGCECLKIKCIISSIPRFHQLRYLRLGGDIVELPEQIGDLQFLQTLDLTQCSVMRKLPPTLVWLCRLVRLFVHRGNTAFNHYKSGTLTSILLNIWWLRGSQFHICKLNCDCVTLVPSLSPNDPEIRQDFLSVSSS